MIKLHPYYNLYLKGAVSVHERLTGEPTALCIFADITL